MTTVAKKVEVDRVEAFAKSATALILRTTRLGIRQALEEDEYEASGADKSMTEAKAKLFADCPELQAINTHLDQTKAYIGARSLPSLFAGTDDSRDEKGKRKLQKRRGGIHLIRAERIEDIDNYLTEREANLGPLVEAFVKVLAKRIEEARAKLGGLAERAVWPTASAVREAYSLRWRWVSFDTPTKVRTFSRAVYDREVEKARTEVAAARDAGIALLRAEMGELVDHMVDRLQPGADGKPKIFKRNSVDALTEFLTLFGDRNAMVQDDALARVTTKLQGILANVDAELIRTDDTVRAAVSKGFTTVKAQLDKLIENAPARRISFDD